MLNISNMYKYNMLICELILYNVCLIICKSFSISGDQILGKKTLEICNPLTNEDTKMTWVFKAWKWSRFVCQGFKKM